MFLLIAIILSVSASAASPMKVSRTAVEQICKMGFIEIPKDSHCAQCSKLGPQVEIVDSESIAEFVESYDKLRKTNVGPAAKIAAFQKKWTSKRARQANPKLYRDEIIDLLKSTYYGRKIVDRFENLRSPLIAGSLFEVGTIRSTSRKGKEENSGSLLGLTTPKLIGDSQGLVDKVVIYSQVSIDSDPITAVLTAAHEMAHGVFNQKSFEDYVIHVKTRIDPNTGKILGRPSVGEVEGGDFLYENFTRFFMPDPYNHQEALDFISDEIRTQMVERFVFEELAAVLPEVVCKSPPPWSGLKNSFEYYNQLEASFVDGSVAWIESDALIDYLHDEKFKNREHRGQLVEKLAIAALDKFGPLWDDVNWIFSDR